MNKDESSPAWLWRASLGLLAGALLLMIGLLAATLAGIADPSPLGQLIVEDRFEHPNAWQIRSDAPPAASPSEQQAGRYRLTVASGGERILLTGPYQVRPPCTIEISVQQIDGASDIEYGLWWGPAETGANLWEGINSDGYLAIGPASPSGGGLVRDWELFPHVRPLGQINVFRVDISRNQVIVRLNNEVGGQFAWAAPQVITPGLLAQSTTDGGTIDVLSLSVWQAQPQ